MKYLIGDNCTQSDLLCSMPCHSVRSVWRERAEFMIGYRLRIAGNLAKKQNPPFGFIWAERMAVISQELGHFLPDIVTEYYR